MKTNILLLIAFFLIPGIIPTCSLAADTKPDTENQQLTQAYDNAFENYLAGNYQKAIDFWNQILRQDPTQVTAKNMIQEARLKLSGSATKQKGKFYALVARGKYREALLKIEEMSAIDTSNPLFPKLADRLKKVTAIVDLKPSNSKPWDLAAQGIFNFVNEEENLPFSYDAFRYAAELDPAETRFAKLVAMLEEEAPSLKLNDTKPAGTGVLEHKKKLALDYIYDSKYYLAIRELESALKLEPKDITALKRLGSAYLQLKDYARAREAWEKALKLAPRDEQLKEYMSALKDIPDNKRPKNKTAKKRQKRPRKARTT